MADKIRQILEDPEFFNLKPSAQLEVLGAVDPEFSAMDLSERLDVIRAARERFHEIQARPDPTLAANRELARLGQGIEVGRPGLPKPELKPVGRQGQPIQTFPAIPAPPGATPEQVAKMQAAKEAERERRARVDRNFTRVPSPSSMVFMGEGEYVDLSQYGRPGEAVPEFATERGKSAQAFALGTYNALVPTTLRAAGGVLSTLSYYSPSVDMADVLREVGDAFENTAKHTEIELPRELRDRVFRDPVDDPTALVDPVWWSHGLGNVFGTMLPMLVPEIAVLRLTGTTAKMMRLKPYTEAAWTAIAGTAAGSFIETLFDSGLQYREAIENGATPETAAAVAVETARREFPVTAAFNLAGLFNPAIKGTVKRALASMIGEGLQEAAQGVAQRTAMRDVAGIEQDIWKPTLQEFLLASIGGAAAGSVIEAAAGEHLGAHVQATEGGPPTIVDEKSVPLDRAGEAREKIWRVFGDETATFPFHALELARAGEAAEASEQTAEPGEWDLRGPVREAIELRRRYREEILKAREEGRKAPTEEEFLASLPERPTPKAERLFTLFGEPISQTRKRFGDYLNALELSEGGLVSIGGPEFAFETAFSPEFRPEIQPSLRHRQAAQKLFGKPWDDLSYPQQAAVDRAVQQRLKVLEDRKKMVRPAFQEFKPTAIEAAEAEEGPEAPTSKILESSRGTHRKWAELLLKRLTDPKASEESIRAAAKMVDRTAQTLGEGPFSARSVAYNLRAYAQDQIFSKGQNADVWQPIVARIDSIFGKPQPQPIAAAEGQPGKRTKKPKAPKGAPAPTTTATTTETPTAETPSTETGAGEPTTQTTEEPQEVAARETRRQPSKPPAYGSEVEIKVPGESTSYKGRYAIRELADVFPSHNPFTFEPNPAYGYTNERNYESKVNAQRVAERSTDTSFDPAFILTESPTGEHGPPIIDEEGNVLGGNARTMILSRVYAAKGQAAGRYRAMLESVAQKFGIKPEALKNFDQPVLVREVAGADAEKVIRDTNKASVASLSRAEQAIADAKRMTPKVIELLRAKLERAGPEATIAEALKGVHGRDVIDALVDAGVISLQEVPEMLEHDQTLSEVGRMRISGMLVGRLFEDARDMEDMPKSLLKKLERIAIPAMVTEGNPEWDIKQEIRSAARLLAEAKPASPARLEDWLAQTDLSGASGRERYSERAIAIARKLLEGQRAVLRAFRGYAEAFVAATGEQDSFFTPPDAESAFQLSFAPEPDIEDPALPGQEGAGAIPPSLYQGRPVTLTYLDGSEVTLSADVVDSLKAYESPSDPNFDPNETLDEAAAGAFWHWDPVLGVFHLNAHAMRLVVPDPSLNDSVGIAIPWRLIDHISSQWDALRAAHPKVESFFQRIQDEVVKKQGYFVAVLNDDSIPFAEKATALLEELAHRQQGIPWQDANVPPNAHAVLASREGRKALAYLLGIKSYEDYVQTHGASGALLEVTVRLMRPGGWEEVGLTPKEALNLTARYLNEFLKTYGAAAEDLIRYTLRGFLSYKKVVKQYAEQTLKRTGHHTGGEATDEAGQGAQAGGLAGLLESLGARIWRRPTRTAERAAQLLDVLEERLRQNDTLGALAGFSELVDTMGAMPVFGLRDLKGARRLYGELEESVPGSGAGGLGRFYGYPAKSRGGVRPGATPRGDVRPSVERGVRSGDGESAHGGRRDEASVSVPPGPVGSSGRLSPGEAGDQRGRGPVPAMAVAGSGGGDQRIQHGGGGAAVGGDLGLGGRIVDRFGFTQKAMASGSMGFGKLDPLLQKHLYPYQQIGVIQMARAMHAHGGALLADGPGTGKTAQILGLAKEYVKRGRKVVIVSIAEAFRFKSVKGELRPTGSYAEWIDRLELGGLVDIHTNKAPKTPQPGRVVLATYNAIVARPLEMDQNTILVFDEAHALKNAHISQRGRAGLDMAREAGQVLYATATPYDKPQEIVYLERLRPFGPGVSMLEGMARDLDLVRVKGRFGERWQPKHGSNWAFVKKKTKDLWNDLFLAGRALRRELRMDGVTLVNEWMELSAEDVRMLNDIERDFMGTVQARMHQRRQIEPRKIPRTVELVKQELDAGRSVIAFVARVNYSEAAIKWYDENGNEHVHVVASSAGTAPSLKGALVQAGIPEEQIAELHGAADPQRIRDSVEDFRSDRARVIIATVEMGGTGLNLDDTTGKRPRTIVVTTAPFSALQIVQAVGRGWRATTKSDLKVIYLRADHPVDEWGVTVALEKMRTLGAVIQGPISRLAPGHGTVTPEEAETQKRLAERMLQYLGRLRARGEKPPPAMAARRRAMIADVASVPQSAAFEMESWKDWLEHFHPEVSDPVNAMLTRRDLKEEYHRMIEQYSNSMLEGANLGAPWWFPYRSASEAVEALKDQRQAIERESKRAAPITFYKRGAGRFGRMIVTAPSQFLVSDVVPTLKDVVAALKATIGDFMRTLAPTAMSPAGKVGGLAMRYRMAEQARRLDQVAAALEAARRMFDRMTPQQVTDFIDRMENGQSQANDDLDYIAGRFREILDRVRDEVRALGTGKLEKYYDTYFPHIWKDKRKAEEIAAQFFGRRPLEGSKTFLKQRKYMNFKDGLQAGLEPVSWNPVDLVLMKISEMGRYIMAHRFLDDMKDAGMVRFVAYNYRPPAGWRKIIDPIGTVYGRPFLTVREAPNAGLYEALEKVAQALGVEHRRGQREPAGIRQAVGAAYPTKKRIATQSGSAEQVIAHELGHMIDLLGVQATGVGMRDLLMNYPGGPVGQGISQAIKDLRSPNAQTRKSAREYLKFNIQAYEKRKAIAKELRALADERHGLSKAYTRSAEEKMAAVVEAWVGARELFQRVAPTAFEAWQKWVQSVPALAPLANIEGTLDLKPRSEDVPIHGLVIKGWWYAPPAIALMLENHLAVGLRRYGTYRAGMFFNNAMNMVQLSLSAFHLANTALDAMATQFSLAAYRLAHGQVVGAAREFVKVPAAPILNVIAGHRLYKAWHSEVIGDPDMADLVKHMLRAGGRAHMSDVYRTSFKEKMLRAFSQGNLLGGLIRIPPAMIEAFSDVTMDLIVPRMKLGAFAATLAARLSLVPEGSSRIAYAAAASEAWDVVEDRLGEVVYDNYFWNRFAKDLLHLVVRSVGWNLGTIRVFAKGALDLVRLPIDLTRRSRNPDFTLAAAYAVAVVPFTALVGALIMKLLSGRWPEKLEDYFFPQTGDTDEYGRPRRVSLPTYFKDMFHLAREPFKTITNKASPLVDLMADILSNRDFYGVKIRNEDDPIVKQLLQVLDRVTEQFQPFGVREAIRAHEEQASSKHIWLPFFGMVPAPAALGRTPAERKAQEYIASRSPVGGRSEEAAIRSRGVRAMARSIRMGLEAGPVTREAISGGYMTPADIKRAIKEAGMTPLEVAFQMLSLEEALRVWQVATPEERRRLAPTLITKMKAIDRMPPAQAQKIINLAREVTRAR